MHNNDKPTNINQSNFKIQNRRHKVIPNHQNSCKKTLAPKPHKNIQNRRELFKIAVANSSRIIQKTPNTILNHSKTPSPNHAKSLKSIQIRPPQIIQNISKSFQTNHSNDKTQCSKQNDKNSITLIYTCPDVRNKIGNTTETVIPACIVDKETRTQCFKDNGKRNKLIPFACKMAQ